jgi:hypothetical protein
MTKLVPALMLLIHATAAAQSPPSAWRVVETTDELTAAGSDRRLILRADDWPAQPPTTADGYAGATIVVVCGDRIPNSAGRSLLFNAGQPLQPFGNGLAYAEWRFDQDSVPLRPYLPLLDSKQVAFLGEERSPYFSPRLLGRLLDAGTLTVRYRAFGGNRTVSFHVAGLRAALAQLPGCRWT